jgi:hypothetical protein
MNWLIYILKNSIEDLDAISRKLTTQDCEMTSEKPKAILSVEKLGYTECREAES